MCLRSWHAPHHFLSIFPEKKAGPPVSAIPTEFPVTMTDGENDYVVSSATEYVNAVYKLGHAVKVEEAASRRSNSKSK